MPINRSCYSEIIFSVKVQCQICKLLQIYFTAPRRTSRFLYIQKQYIGNPKSVLTDSQGISYCTFGESINYNDGVLIPIKESVRLYLILVLQLRETVIQ